MYLYTFFSVCSTVLACRDVRHLFRWLAVVMHFSHSFNVVLFFIALCRVCNFLYYFVSTSLIIEPNTEKTTSRMHITTKETVFSRMFCFFIFYEFEKWIWVTTPHRTLYLQWLLSEFAEKSTLKLSEKQSRKKHHGKLSCVASYKSVLTFFLYLYFGGGVVFWVLI